MEAMGMLGLAKLAHATKNGSYFAMSERPLSYTLAETTLFQADHGFRDGLPSFMALAAMSGTYVAGMEGHTSAWYVSEWLRVGGSALSPAAVALGTAYAKYAGGVMRAAYPSGMPAAALAPWAYQTGAPNNASIEIPVEDYRFDRTTPGIVGQEVYGSGSAFDMAILSRRHGAAATTYAGAPGAGVDAEAAWKPAQYIWPRTLSARRGEAVVITVYYPHSGLLSAAQPDAAAPRPTAAAVVDIETANTISDFAVKRVQRTADGHLELWVMADSKAPLGLHETVFWLNDTAAADTLVRPVRVTIDVVRQV